MADTGEQHVAEIQENLACPACEYNLRGLRGDVIQCPECGATCDVAQLIANQWTLPWHRAPRLNRVYAPVAWVVLAPFVWILGLIIVGKIYEGTKAPPIGLVSSTIGVAMFLGWCIALVGAYRVFADMRGVRLAFISHLLFVAYLLGFAAIISASITCIRAIFALDALAIAISLFVMLLGVPLVWLGRRGEKYVARRCIRRHLQLQSAAAT